ncbi:methionine--tRNA ligase [Candidatus Saccharibacteria bacterium RIFCSPHIGHO2_12_FULL_41_12]|nr:MAG: methionine--tRNA ligase [Candidatus Saccharibacteria bacterium RIFCSPHIGHO2_12_FULL_41_12]
MVSDQKDNYYVSTSLPYVNGPPHLGHAMEFVMADVLARYARKKGKNVIFSAGTDEHGSKIVEKAKEENISPRELADANSQLFKDLMGKLNISHDRFIRTTDAGHEQRAQLIWKKLEKDIYKNKYTGWYCTGCEEYKNDAHVKETNGVCPDHNRKYEQLEEENYFFALSKYAVQIKQAINSEKMLVIPKTRRNETLALLERGLEDISISRPKDKLDWGISVPGDDSQVMYVWFEALMNYVTVLGYPEHQDFKDFWPANMHVIGKGINRFHTAIWPGILLSLGVELPKAVYVHGYVGVDGAKMSKSLGNAVTPDSIIDAYGVDAFRYYFLRHIPSYGDGDYSKEKFETMLNAELANELGNIVSRTAAMIVKYQEGLIGNIPPPEHDIAEYTKNIENCHFDQALEMVWQQIRGLNQYIDEQKPWVMAKSGDADHLGEVLSYIVSSLLEIGDLLLPFMPTTAEKIITIFKTGVVAKDFAPLFPRIEIKK